MAKFFGFAINKLNMNVIHEDIFSTNKILIIYEQDRNNGAQGLREA